MIKTKVIAATVDSFSSCTIRLNHQDTAKVLINMPVDTFSSCLDELVLHCSTYSPEHVKVNIKRALEDAAANIK